MADSLKAETCLSSFGSGSTAGYAGNNKYCRTPCFSINVYIHSIEGRHEVDSPVGAKLKRCLA